MKKLLIISALVIAGALSVHAQGRIAFASAGVGVNAKFATSPLSPTGSNLITASMANFRADLFWAPGNTTVGVDASTLAPQNYNANFSTVALQAGYFGVGTRTVEGWVSGPIVAQVRVWDTSFGSYAQAHDALGGSWFESPLFIVTPTVVPTAPANLVGLGNGVTYTLIYNIPEPTTFTLAGLGAAALLIFRRRRS
jgi:hypothetical protein